LLLLLLLGVFARGVDDRAVSQSRAILRVGFFSHRVEGQRATTDDLELGIIFRHPPRAGDVLLRTGGNGT